MGGRGGGGGRKRATAAQTSAFRNKISRLYASGHSISQIGKATGRSASSVHSHLVNSGVQLRPRGGTSRNR